MSLIYKALSQAGGGRQYMQGADPPPLPAHTPRQRLSLSKWPWIVLAVVAGIWLVYVFRDRSATAVENSVSVRTQSLASSRQEQGPDFSANSSSAPDNSRSAPDLLPQKKLTNAVTTEADQPVPTRPAVALVEVPEQKMADSQPTLAENEAPAYAALKTSVAGKQDASVHASSAVPASKSAVPASKVATVAQTEPRKLPENPIVIIKQNQGKPSGQHTTPLTETRQAAMTRLTREVNMAMASGDNEKMESSLAEIANLTGPDSPYLLKLQAYWHLTRSEHENSPRELAQAEELLARVLTQVPDDLDAGLNMAIVEIREQNYTGARQRLETLVMKYSEDDRARHILRTIPSRF